jgi:putative hydrolase of the HAD superfamily
MIRLICLDADDTLWHNEAYFVRTKKRLAELLADFAPADAVEARVEATEHGNLAAYGYGAKGFVLSMIEAAAALAGPALGVAAVEAILTLGKEMLAHPVEMLEGVPDALDALADRAPLVLVTKGDLWHQEAKLAASGLGERFAGVEIVSDKQAATYARIFARHGVAPGEAVMAGNSMRSDVLPALEAGAWAAFVPFELCWSHEAADAPVDHPRYRELASLAELPAWIDAIGATSPLSLGERGRG